MKHNLKVTAILITMFLVTQLIGLLIVGSYDNGLKLPFGMEPPEDIKESSLTGGLSSIVSAFIIAILFSIIARVLVLINFSGFEFFYSLAVSTVLLNVVLGVFNLIPIHPLDGFKVVGGLLSEKQANEWYQLERFGIIFLLAFLFLPVGGSNMLNLVLGPVIRFIIGVLIPESLGAGIV